MEAYMTTLRSARGFSAPLLAMAIGLLGLSGCGLGVGDHVFYRVAVSPTARSADCYNNNMVPADVKDDTTNLSGGTTFILYIPGDKAPELDTGDVVVPGAATDTGYRFTGNMKDVDYPNGDTRTTTTKITVDLTVDGDTVSGKSTTVTTRTCVGAMCPGGF